MPLGGAERIGNLSQECLNLPEKYVIWLPVERHPVLALQSSKGDHPAYLSSAEPRQVGEFLGTAGFCWLWIPGFAELAAFLYRLTKNGQPFHWEEEEQQAFHVI